MVGVARIFGRPVAQQYAPAADEGFFGPGSATWKVWSYPTSMAVGFVRAVTIEQLNPHLNAAVEATGDVRERTRTRYERTMRYFALIAFGDTASAAKVADVLVKVHSKVIGTDPVTGGRYDANDPAAQLWIHMTAWHSILYCYEVYGPGGLSDAEERRYWAECARAAECQTIDPVDVPRSRAEVVDYFAAWRPRLAASEAAQSMTAYILRSDFIFPAALPWWTKPVRTVVGRLVGRAVIATYPRYQRKMFGLRQSAAEQVLLRFALRRLFAFLARDPVRHIRVARFFIPDTVSVLAPAILGIEARTPVMMTPREAQARYGFDRPALAHPDLRREQEQRVFERGLAPSEEGLVESERYIGGRE
ncbi:DUF2236 domain-containing protein [Nocardia panacis]|uniref:DUF2236 domain-containing protein n=1 Tax=Nocardia panacis TaxID=2340916 RepID=A0A3A4KM46_9NOCA|nr:oxygenase MpaB family protein [Nocardia panacis]RJO75106.1 DUF2236 domain-containing protein [Nocardia panacis]